MYLEVYTFLLRVFIDGFPIACYCFDGRCNKSKGPRKWNVHIQSENEL